MGLPGLAGAEHIGITVPDLEAATRFFVDVIGCKVAFDAGPFASEDDWMQQHLGVHPRSKINKLRMLKCANGPSIELFEYDVRSKAKKFQKAATSAVTTSPSTSPISTLRSRTSGEMVQRCWASRHR